MTIEQIAKAHQKAVDLERRAMAANCTDDWYALNEAACDAARELKCLLDALLEDRPSTGENLEDGGKSGRGGPYGGGGRSARSVAPTPLPWSRTGTFCCTARRPSTS